MVAGGGRRARARARVGRAWVGQRARASRFPLDLAWLAQQVGPQGLMAAPAPVMVVGGGIIGASIAYHLTLRGISPVVVEGTRVAAAASGKAGGFLAGSWGDGSPTEQLHRVSFAMHERIAEKLEVESYRKLPTMSVRAGPGKAGQKNVPWLDKEVSGCSLMDADTAQVSPRELTEKLMAAAVSGGATLVHGAVEGVISEPVGDESAGVVLRGVVVDGKEMLAERIVFALGPWSILLERWIPGQVIPMEGVKSTSIVFEHEKDSVAPFALFCDEDRNGCHLEVYPRPNGEVYMCGVGGSEYLNADQIAAVLPDDVVADPARVAAAQKSFARMSSLGDKAVDHSQACMRPCPPDGMPLIGALPDAANGYIAAGHNCWGILWAPVTGLAMTELLVDGASSSVDLDAFDPLRFRPDARQKRRKSSGREHVG